MIPVPYAEMAQFYARPGTSHYSLCVNCQTDEQLNELVRNCTETAFPRAMRTEQTTTRRRAVYELEGLRVVDLAKSTAAYFVANGMPLRTKNSVAT
ncbi:hypothetical protein CRG93_06575 [Escherichia sp. E2593]|nr:hypothetical protein D9738_22715 [Escherichia sp. E10V5]TGC10171.1 hypothetical protein CRG93_06575 [Escherichia sp. E2593]